MFKNLIVPIKLFGLAALALIFVTQSARAQIYDSLTVVRLQDRILYLYPQGYVPVGGLSYFPSAYGYGYWPYSYFDTYRYWPSYYYPGIGGSYNPTSFVPSSYESPLTSPSFDTSITVRVPSNAEVFIQGKKMSETGSERRFSLPSLDPSTTYDYDVKITWSENGNKISDEKHLKIHGGDHQSLTYVAALTKNQANSNNGGAKK
jgi:uncharacterized protein (TIGR03000 family)